MEKFLKLITSDYMEGVSEPWCNNEAVAILPFVYKHNQHWFLLINEKNPLLTNKQGTHYATLTGGCVQNQTRLATVTNEILEETGIDISNNKKVIIHALGSYYANKTSIKLWHLYGVDISSLNLSLNETYFGQGDGSIGENGINATFVNEKELDNVNDALALAIYGKLNLHKIITCFHPTL